MSSIASIHDPKSQDYITYEEWVKPNELTRALNANTLPKYRVKYTRGIKKSNNKQYNHRIKS
jgi:hypothetical protein